MSRGIQVIAPHTSDLCRVPVFEIVTFRSSLSFLACAWGARQADIKLFGRRANFPLLLARGICGAAVSELSLCSCRGQCIIRMHSTRVVLRMQAWQPPYS
jgi:hypothetical protein